MSLFLVAKSLFKNYDDLGTKITGPQLETCVQAQLSVPVQFFNRKDTIYKCLPTKEVIELIHLTVPELPKYSPESFDCDNFAIAVMANVHIGWSKYGKSPSRALAFGYFSFKPVGKNFHAINWYLDENLTLKFIEPQRFQVGRYGSEPHVSPDIEVAREVFG